jgi:hypothetical protein
MQANKVHPYVPTVCSQLDELPADMKRLIFHYMIKQGGLKSLLSTSKNTHDFTKEMFTDDALEQLTLKEYDETTLFTTLVLHLVKTQYAHYTNYAIKKNVQDTATLTIGDKRIKVLLRCCQVESGALVDECVITFTALNLGTTVETGDHIIFMYNVINNDTTQILLDQSSLTRTSVENINDMLPEFRNSATSASILNDVLLYIQNNFSVDGVYEHVMDGMAQSVFKSGEFKLTFKFKRKQSLVSSISDAIMGYKSECKVYTKKVKKDFESLSDFLLQNGTYYTPFVKALQAKTSQVSVPTTIPSLPPQRERTISIHPTVFADTAPIPLLGYKNANLIWQYAIMTKTPSVYLMQFYNTYLEKDTDGVTVKQKQDQITRTLDEWKKHKFSQPKFAQVQTFEEPPSEELYLQSCPNYGVLSRWKQDDLLRVAAEQSDEINAWVHGLTNNVSTINNDTRNHLPGFYFYPLLSLTLPLPGGPGGGDSSTNKYKQTKSQTRYKDGKYTIYTGKRGGEYICINEKYIPLCKLKEK